MWGHNMQQHSGDVHADPRRAYAVTRRLSFRQIERMAEGAKHLGEPDRRVFLVADHPDDAP